MTKTTSFLVPALVFVLCAVSTASGFLGRVSPHSRPALLKRFAESQGDKLREASGIRPSLHPTTINAIAEVLKQRASDDSSNLRISETVKPLDVAVAAGKIAADFLQKRRDTSTQDGMEFNIKEEQTIAGRVVGVVVRLDELERTLAERTRDVAWIKKYNEWASFGVLEEDGLLQLRIKDDPLFSVARAECLLAIFLQTVEAPKLKEIGETVPGGSQIDFIDEDRLRVLLPEDFQ
jgi:hypothetical protein